MASISATVASYQADLRSRVSGRAAECSVFGGLDFLLAPWVEPWFWSMLIGVA